MLEIVLTLDYEIHGNGEGSPRKLMLEPVDRMLERLDAYGAKLTVMADAAEILRFRRHARETGSDDYCYRPIARQLQRTVRTGHDVQLHLHPGYFNARPAGDRWEIDGEEYDLAPLGFERINELVAKGKAFLEELLRVASPSYSCIAFRSANWSMHPSRDIVRALAANGIRADTSVFKFGRRDGAVRFDYTHAHSAVAPWRAAEADVCLADPSGPLIELPIYSESRRLHAFASANRLFRAGQTRRHPLPPGVPGAAGPRRSLPRRIASLLGGRHAWKLDFNQCSGRQLSSAVERIASRYGQGDATLPVVLIGHSKLYNRLNQRQLESFLAHVADRPRSFRFATLSEAIALVERTGAATAAAALGESAAFGRVA